MSEVAAKQSTEANNAFNIKNPSLGWMIGFLFVVSFLGLFSVVPLRKVFPFLRICVIIYITNFLAKDQSFCSQDFDQFYFFLYNQNCFVNYVSDYDH